MMLTRCPDETMVAWQACGGEAGVWRRGIGMAQASGLKGRSWVVDRRGCHLPLERADGELISCNGGNGGKKKGARDRDSHARAHPPPAAREPRRRSQPAGRHASAVSSEGDLRLCLASPAACASEFKPLARPESARAREPREKGPGLRVPVCARA